MATIKALFESMQMTLPDKDLEGRILSAIDSQRIVQAKRDYMIARIGFVGSFATLAFSGWSYGQVFLQSDFWNLVSLLFSDAAVVLLHWGDFSYSLLETFPALPIMLFLVPVFTFVLSVGIYSRAGGNARRGHYHYA